MSMEPIREGASGAAVEDIQERMIALGYTIDEGETTALHYGASTAAAVAAFRADHALPSGTIVDTVTWTMLVNEGYHMGDRTLYLRLPNFEGADVRQLQTCLNILGFSCGATDGCYGVHTEAAVKQFQESQGMLADGMAFADTFDAIERLHHVWAGTPAAGPHPMGGMGFARAAGALENTRLSITAEDPISRNVAGRIWNLAAATTDRSGLDLIDDSTHARPDDRAVLVLASTALSEDCKLPNVAFEDVETLPLRLRTAMESSRRSLPIVRVELPLGRDYNGTFTVSDAQTFAVILLDAICTAFDADSHTA